MSYFNTTKLRHVINYKRKVKSNEYYARQCKGKANRKVQGLKINYIAEQTGIPREIISAFKNKRRELWEESLIKLNAFLDKY